MANQTLGVTISADVSSLQAKLAIAQAELRAFNTEVKSTASSFTGASDEMKATLLPQLEASAAGAIKAKAEISGLKNEIAELNGGGLSKAFEGLEGALTPLRNVQSQMAEFAELFAAAFAIDKISDWVSEISEAGEQVVRFSQILGTTVEQFSSLSLEAQISGISQEELAQSLERLEKSMGLAAGGAAKQVELFKAIGVSLDDLKNKSPNEVFEDIGTKLGGFADGANKTALAMELLGRSGAQMIPTFNEMAAGSKSTSDRLAETGAILSGPVAQGMEETHQNLTIQGAAWEGLAETLFTAFKPAIDSVVNGLTDLVEAFNDAVKSSGTLAPYLRDVVMAFDGILVAVDSLKAGLEILWQTVAASIESIVEEVALLGVEIKDAVSLDWPKMQSDHDAGMAKIQADADARFDKMKQAGLDWQKTMTELFSNISSGGVDVSGGPAKKETDKPKAPAIPDASAGSAQIAQWQEQLDQIHEKTSNLLADTKAADLDYWNAKLKLVDSGSKEWLELERKVYELKKGLAQDDLQQQLATVAAKQEAVRADYASVAALETQKLALLKRTYGEDSSQYQNALREQERMAREHNAQLVAIAAENLSAQNKLQQDAIQGEIDTLDSDVDAGRIAANKKYDIEKELYDKIYQLRRQDLVNQQSLYAQGTIEAARINNEIAALDQQHATQIEQINKQASDRQAADNKKMADSFASDAMQMLQGKKSFSQEAIQLSDQLLQKEIGNIAESVLQYVQAQFTKTAAATVGATTQAAVVTAGASTEKAVTASTAEAGIAAHAAKAAAGAYDAMAGIPIVGPVLGAAAAAVTFGAVMAFGNMFSAEGGWDKVPYDGAPTLLHKDEMVLSAGIANPLRNLAMNDNLSNMARGGSFTAGGSVSGGNVHHWNPTFHVNGAKSPEVTAETIMKGLDQGVRNAKHLSSPTLRKLLAR